MEGFASKRRGRPRKDSPVHQPLVEDQATSDLDNGNREAGGTGLESPQDNGGKNQKLDRLKRDFAAIRAALTGESFIIRKR